MEKNSFQVTIKSKLSNNTVNMRKCFWLERKMIEIARMEDGFVILQS